MKRLLLAACALTMMSGAAVAQSGKNGWGGFGAPRLKSSDHLNDAAYAGYVEATKSGILGYTYAGGTFYISSKGNEIYVKDLNIDGDNNTVDVSGATDGNTTASSTIGDLDTIVGAE